MSNAAPLDLESVRCDLCHADDARELFVASDRRYGVPGDFPVARCRRCGLVYVNPRPGPAALARYYPQAYRPHAATAPQHAGRIGPAVRALVFRGRAGLAASWLYNSVAYRAFLPRRTPGRVLDIGCGTGDYLQAWAELGWETAGIEPDAAAAAVARARLGATIHHGFVEDAPLAAGAFDAITMSHSLEHVRSPRAVLARVHAALAPAGRLLVMVPNFRAWDRAAFGARWYGLEVPRHLYHFEPATITAVLEASGFAVEQLGGTAHAEGVVRALGLPRGALVRAMATAALLPLAALRRSTSLWVIARPVDRQ